VVLALELLEPGSGDEIYRKKYFLQTENTVCFISKYKVFLYLGGFFILLNTFEKIRLDPNLNAKKYCQKVIKNGFPDSSG